MPKQDLEGAIAGLESRIANDTGQLQQAKAMKAKEAEKGKNLFSRIKDTKEKAKMYSMKYVVHPITHFGEYKNAGLTGLDGILSSALVTGTSRLVGWGAALPLMLINPLYALIGGLAAGGFTYAATNTLYKLTRDMTNIATHPIIRPVKTVNMITGRAASPIKTLTALAMSPFTLIGGIFTYPFKRTRYLKDDQGKPITRQDGSPVIVGTNKLVDKIAGYTGIIGAGVLCAPGLLYPLKTKLSAVGSKISSYATGLYNKIPVISEYMPQLSYVNAYK